MDTKLLDFPKVDFIRDRSGRIDAAYVRIQDPSVKAVRSVQPNPQYMVYFHVDRNGVPVSIVFHEPVFGIPLWNIVETMYMDPQKKPAGMKKEAVYAFITDPKQVMRILVQIAQALASLMEDKAATVVHGAPAPCPA